jgi:hypothetical protein
MNAEDVRIVQEKEKRASFQHYFYYTTLSCLSEDRNDKSTYYILCFPYTELLPQCVLEISFVSIILFAIAALIQSKLESESLVVTCQQKHATPK